MAVTQSVQNQYETVSRRVLLLAALVVLLPISADAQYTFTDLDVDLHAGPAALYACAATGINDGGLIVGGCNDANQNDVVRGFLYDGGRFTEIYFPTIRGEAAEVARSHYQDAPYGQFPPLLPLRPTVSGGIVPQDVNINGQVTGSYFHAGRLRGFLKEHGVVTSISFPNATLTEAVGLNDAGHVVGDYRGADGVFHGFLFANGVYTTFGADLGAADVNNAGLIVGCYASCSRGFLYDGSTFTSIDVPGAIVTQLSGINDVGHMVGNYYDGTSLRGFVYDGTTFETIEVPGAFLTQVSKVNNLGHVVGHYVTEPSPGIFESHPFVARR